MQDHGGLYAHAAAALQKHFVIGGAVFARIGNGPGLQGLPGLGQIPAVGIRARKSQGVQAVQRNKIVHGAGGREIGVFNGRFDHRRTLGQAGGGLLAAGAQNILRLADLQKRVAALVLGGRKFIGIFGHKLTGGGKGSPAGAGGALGSDFLRALGSAAGKHQRTGGPKSDAFGCSHCTASGLEKVRV